MPTKTSDYGTPVEKPEYYYRFYKDEEEVKWHGVYERLIKGEDGICIYESKNKDAVMKYLTELKRVVKQGG